MSEHREYHGHAHNGDESPAYRSWKTMKRRCYDPKFVVYKNYGGRGIRVCERWRHSFSAFLADMGARPADHTLDRIDPKGDYDPSNCRWLPSKLQNRNRSDNLLLSAFGETLCAAAWCERFHMRGNLLRARLRRGMTVEEALTAPRRTHKRLDHVRTA